MQLPVCCKEVYNGWLAEIAILGNWSCSGNSMEISILAFFIVFLNRKQYIQLDIIKYQLMVALVPSAKQANWSEEACMETKFCFYKM